MECIFVCSNCACLNSLSRRNKSEGLGSKESRRACSGGSGVVCSRFGGGGRWESSSKSGQKYFLGMIEHEHYPCEQKNPDLSRSTVDTNILYLGSLAGEFPHAVVTCNCKKALRIKIRNTDAQRVN